MLWLLGGNRDLEYVVVGAGLSYSATMAKGPGCEWEYQANKAV